MAKPEIRLKGFEGEWKKAQISTFCIINPHSSIPYSFEYVDLESVVGTKIVSHRTEMLDTAPSRAQRLAKDGDIFYQTVRPYQKNNCIYRDMGQPYVFSTGYAQIRTNINPNFLFNVLQSDSFVNKVLLDCTGTSYPAINPTKLSQIEVDFSGNEEEQKALANYFSSLDSLLQSTIKKIASLKQMKQACLVSMFPQAGETTPRVRFKGFEGKWGYSSLGEIFEERVESNIYGEMLSVTMNNGVIKASENGRFDNSNSDKSKYKVVKVNDIAYNSMRMWQGASGCSQYEGIVSPAYTVVVPCEGIDSLFFSYMFKTLPMITLFRLHSQGLTSDTWNLKYPAFSKIKVIYPKEIQEQQRIASYFRSLDKQISLQEKRLEKLKQIKAACLDKMFV